MQLGTYLYMTLISASKVATISPKPLLAGLRLTSTLASLSAALSLSLLDSSLPLAARSLRRLELGLACRLLLDSSSDFRVLELLELSGLLFDTLRVRLRLQCLLLRARGSPHGLQLASLSPRPLFDVESRLLHARAPLVDFDMRFHYYDLPPGTGLYFGCGGELDTPALARGRRHFP